MADLHREMETFIESMKKMPKGAKGKDEVPLKFAVALYPNFASLDMCGPMEVLTALQVFYPTEFYMLAETLEPVVSGMPKGLFRADSKPGHAIVPTHTFATAPAFDVLLVPGGFGSSLPSAEPVVAFIKSVYPKLKYLFTVCTGAELAAKAGVLDGKRATTNKLGFKLMTSLGPKVKWVYHARWVVDGNVYTTSGVSAGIDGMVGFVADVYGKEVAERSAEFMEYDAHWDPSWDPFADKYALE